MDILRSIFPKLGTIMRFHSRGYFEDESTFLSDPATKMDIFLDSKGLPKWFWPDSGRNRISTEQFMVIGYVDHVHSSYSKDYWLDFDMVLMQMKDGKIVKHQIKKTKANVASYIFVRFPIFDVVLFVAFATLTLPMWWTLEAVNFVKNKISNR